MGEVLLAHDVQIGRDVAIKRLLSNDPTDSEVKRFMREAQIQGRLEHPAIPAVHELGFDPDGLPYFAMKRLTGTTLQSILDAADARFARQRLLRAFADACLAVELAHVHGVIHRDLKPDNIMLGEFGEVYVLDWGVAKIVGEESTFEDIAYDGLATRAGATVGTKGYSAPEQESAEPNIDARADVFSLGRVLEKILAVDPDPPPELLAVAEHATQNDRAARLATARELGALVQGYLDGDRDLALRRKLADNHLERARAAFAAEDRAVAMHSAGRALALDPQSAPAAALVSQLMLEPPRVPPAELRAELAVSDATEVRRHALGAMAGFLAVIPMFPVGMWNGLKSWPIVLALGAAAVVMAGFAWLIIQKPLRSLPTMTAYLIANAAFIAMLGYAVGALLLGPMIASIITMSLVFYPHFARRSWLVIAVMMCGWILPLVLERAEVLAPSWSIENGYLIISSTGLDINSHASPILFAMLTSGAIALAGVLGAMYVRGHRDAKHQLLMQAWHLRQLLPRTE
jgi:serine/threonine-protein kinase